MENGKSNGSEKLITAEDSKKEIKDTSNKSTFNIKEERTSSGTFVSSWFEGYKQEFKTSKSNGKLQNWDVKSEH